MFFQKQFMCHLMGQQTDLLASNVKNLVYEHVGRDSMRAEALEKLGLISDTPIDKKATPMDTLTHYLSKKLSYRELMNTQEIIIEKMT